MMTARFSDSPFSLGAYLTLTICSDPSTSDNTRSNPSPSNSTIRRRERTDASIVQSSSGTTCKFDEFAEIIANEKTEYVQVPGVCSALTPVGSGSASHLAKCVVMRGATATLIKSSCVHVPPRAGQSSRGVPAQTSTASSSRLLVHICGTVDS